MISSSLVMGYCGGGISIFSILYHFLCPLKVAALCFLDNSYKKLPVLDRGSMIYNDLHSNVKYMT